MLLDLSPKQLENFGAVCNEILRIKIDILYKISIEKNEDFLELLKEFLPDALENEHKYLLDNLYILNQTSKNIIFDKNKNETENIDINKDTIVEQPKKDKVVENKLIEEKPKKDKHKKFFLSKHTN